jgi:hypothetical protein
MLHLTKQSTGSLYWLTGFTGLTGLTGFTGFTGFTGRRFSSTAWCVYVQAIQQHFFTLHLQTSPTSALLLFCLPRIRESGLSPLYRCVYVICFSACSFSGVLNPEP